MNSIKYPLIFDKKRLRIHKERSVKVFSDHDFLFVKMAELLCERLDYIKKDFPLVLDLGAKTGILARMLGEKKTIGRLLQMDNSHALLSAASGDRIVADEEALPFADDSFDLILSVGTLHWANDLAGSLVQIRKILKPDGLFIAMLFGGQTLKELRTSFEKAEIENRGGVSPRVSPFIDVQTGGQLLQRAGFSLPVVDSDVIGVEYPHPLKLMKELRGMGESNCMLGSAKEFTPCSLMMVAVDNYLRDYSNEHGRIEASFEIITLTGWKPCDLQPKPAVRGSGKVNLGDIL
ncbi:MAG: methyltransferase domain-containing protein [Rickettsiales bacterium]